MFDESNPFQEVTDTNMTDDRTTVIKPISHYKSQPVRWLEDGRIALGKLTMIAGDPGLGKSFITLDLASRVTRGELPTKTDPNRADPNRVTLTDQGQVVLLNAEDDAGDTIRPRLEAMNADITRVHVFEGIVAPMGRCVGLTQLDTDIKLLANQMKKINNLKLIIIDPISAYMGKTDSHNNADVRAVLAELSRLAAWTGAAVVCVTHLNKDSGGKRAIYRAMGSLAFTAAARAVHLVTKHPDDANKRIVAPVKNNLGVEMRPKVYTINDGAVEWLDEEVEWNADTLENSPNGANNGSHTQPSAIEEAKRFLEAALAEGERPSSDLLAESKALGISEITLQRARRALAIKSVRRGQSWNWVYDTIEHPAPLGAIRATPEPDTIPGLHDQPDSEPEYGPNSEPESGTEREYENGFVAMREDRLD